MALEMPTNDQIATALENVSNKKHDFLLAHYVRMGHLDHIEELIKYAKENGFKPIDVVEMLLTSVSGDMLTLFHDQITDNPIEVVKGVSSLFAKRFGEAVLQDMVLREIFSKDGKK